MNVKQQTPLAYLMRLLGVSLADLGDYLYVAQTSISKWRTGARELKPGSEHFGGIVEYFTMLQRDAERRERMVRLFEELYPGQPLEDAQDFAQALRTFLGGKVMPSASARQAAFDEGRQYTAQVGVFTGQAGRGAALAQLAAHLAEEAPQEARRLCAADRFDPLAPARLLPGLPARHTLHLLLAAPPPELILSPLADVLCHPQAQARLLPRDAPFSAGASCYVAGKALSLWGDASGPAPYMAMYNDALSVQAHQALFDAAWRDAPPPFEVYGRQRLGPDAYQAARDMTLDERLDWFSPTLPYLTMGSSLLMEVLKSNGVSGRVWTRVLEGYRILYNTPLRLYVPARALEQAQLSMPTLSMVCGQEMRMTPAQASRHLLNTAALLRAGRSVQVLPVQTRPQAGLRRGAFVKRNAMAGYLDFASGRVHVTQRPALVEAFMGALDMLWAEATRQAREGAYVAGILERTALEQ